MADEPADIPIQDRYEKQIAADLEKNRAEQAVLRERLARLEAEEEWLSGMQGSLPARQGMPAISAEEPARTEPQDAAPALAEAAVPPQRVEAPRTSATSAIGPAEGKGTKKGSAKKTSAKTPTGNTAKRTAAKTTATKTTEPPLGDVLELLLAKRPGEPLTAAEVVTALEKEFPERARDTNTVRNTLERLVAKSRIERAKQGKTVFYTGLRPEAEKTGAELPGTEAADTSASEELDEVPAQA